MTKALQTDAINQLIHVSSHFKLLNVGTGTITYPVNPRAPSETVASPQVVYAIDQGYSYTPLRTLGSHT